MKYNVKKTYTYVNIRFNNIDSIKYTTVYHYIA